MNKEESKIYEYQKELVLARFKTLNKDAKIVLGGDREITVSELINHINKGDEFGKKVILVQIEMLKILTNV